MGSGLTTYSKVRHATTNTVGVVQRIYPLRLLVKVGGDLAWWERANVELLTKAGARSRKQPVMK